MMITLHACSSTYSPYIFYIHRHTAVAFLPTLQNTIVSIGYSWVLLKEWRKFCQATPFLWNTTLTISMEVFIITTGHNIISWVAWTFVQLHMYIIMWGGTFCLVCGIGLQSFSVHWYAILCKVVALAAMACSWKR